MTEGLENKKSSSWIRRFISGIAGRALNFLSGAIPLWMQGRPLWSRHDTRKFIDEAFEGNGLCFAATMEIATSMAEAPLKVKRKDGESVPDTNPLSRLLERPNDFQTMRELIIETVVFMVITGKAFWLLANEPDGKYDASRLPTYIQGLNPEYVTPLFLDGQLHYEFNNFSTPKKIFKAAQIIQFKEAPDLKDPLMGGMSPIIPIRRHIDIDNVIARYVDDFFHNDATPPSVLIFKNRTSDTEQERTRREMQENHARPGKYHSLGILFGDAKLERLGINVKDLDLDPVLFFVESRILQAFNVPPILLGAAVAMKVSGWGSNYEEARKSFQAENLAPRRRNMEELLKIKLASKFGPYEIYFDESNVVALANERKERRQQANEAWNTGAMTLNQWLTEWGYKTIGDPGEIRKPSNLGGETTFTVGKDKAASNEKTATGKDQGPVGASAEGSAVPSNTELTTTQDTVLNGAQVTAAKDIVMAVANKELPRDAGIAMLKAFFNLDEPTAKAVMGSAGDGFVPADKSNPAYKNGDASKSEKQQEAA